MRLATYALAAAVVVLAACTSSKHRAPIEVRDIGSRPAASTAAPPAGARTPAAVSPESAAVAEDAAPPPAPGTYVVKPGDTLIRIGLDHGQDWRDIARWSRLENPNVLDVGRVLRVVPPEVEPAPAGAPVEVPVTSTVASPVAVPATLPATRVDTAPVTTPAASGASTAPAARPASTVGNASNAAGAGNAGTAANAANAAKDADDALTWQWPAAGPVLRGFDEAQSKGVVIGGRAGDPVLAAADGRVAYAGSGLRGYGNLIIVKHNGTYLSAYAHNQALLVKEDQVVRRGQKIAEMGATDAQRVQLHFEIRRLGRPVDPTRLLPAR